MILTDRELITIHEILHKGGRERYGGVWHYVPLDWVERLSMTRGHRGLVTLSVHLPGGSRIPLQFEPSARDELAELVAKFSELKEDRSRQAATPGALLR